MKLKLITAVCLCFGILSLPGFAEELPKITEEEAAGLKKVENILEEALRKKDFSSLKPDVPTVKPPLFWTTCWKNQEKISFGELVSRLTELSRGVKILVNPQSLNLLSEMVETYGWSGEKPYLYFDFSFGFDRLYGIHTCAKRSKDFVVLGKDQFPDEFTGEPLWVLAKLNKSIQTGDYGPMRKHVPSGKIYRWLYCSPGDALPREYSFESFNQALQREMGNNKIHVVGKAQVSVPREDGSFGATIQTKGWGEKFTPLQFFFELNRPNKQWEWNAVCYPDD